jgi:uncharacterized protein YcaQ
VDGTHPGEFLDLLHRKRLGFEYWDKVLCAIPIEEFPWFRALMAAGGETRPSGLAGHLVEEGHIALVQVEGVRTPFYAPPDAEERLAAAERAPLSDRARFLAPLDPLLWCRAALKKVWGFEYAWEVYKKPAHRRYGYYVLPVLHRGRFVARFDGRYDAKTRTLHVLGYWEEPDGLPLRHPAIQDAFRRFVDSRWGAHRLAQPVLRN